MFGINFPDISGWLSSHKPEVVTGLIIAGVVYIFTKSKFLSIIAGALTIALGVTII